MKTYKVTPLKVQVVLLTRTVLSSVWFVMFDGGLTVTVVKVFVSKLVLSEPSSNTVMWGVTSAVVTTDVVFSSVGGPIGKVNVVGFNACRTQPVQMGPASEVVFVCWSRESDGMIF